jgi:DNA-binding NarL/FixJ family response regulator
VAIEERATSEAEEVVSDPVSTTTMVARPESVPAELSRRELEVLTIVAAGLSDKQVAGQLGISPKTVRNHLSQVFRKLGAGNRVEAVTNAMRRGLLTL